MKTLLVLLIGAALGVGVYIYFNKSGARREMDRAGDRASETAGDLKEKWTNTMADFDTDEIREELNRTGRVIRKKAAQAGTAISDATSDARITAQIKSRFAVESDLSVLKISVNTTDGVVTLAGTASSHEAITKAMKVVLEVEGANQVVSTLQVKP